MAHDSQAYRLVLSSGQATASDDDRVRILKGGLGFDEEESRRLEAALPVELVVASMASERLGRLVEDLERTGIAVRVDELRVRPPTCAKHRRLGADGVCPRCEDERACAVCLRVGPAKVCSSCARSLRRRRAFRRFRILILALLTAAIALTMLSTRHHLASWRRPLRVLLHPIPADRSSKAIGEHLSWLRRDDVQPIAEFLAGEAVRYGVAIDPLVDLDIGRALDDAPPPLPPPGSMLDVALWSLKTRWWVFSTERAQGLEPADVRIFVVYHEARPSTVLDHSVGVEKLHVAIAHVFASNKQTDQNNVVMAHELLHTLGATDKYDAFGRPAFPHGYAEPNRQPRHPQLQAELMGGRVPVEPGLARMPEGLQECVIGPMTAAEIGWLDR